MGRIMQHASMIFLALFVVVSRKLVLVSSLSHRQPVFSPDRRVFVQGFASGVFAMPSVQPACAYMDQRVQTKTTFIATNTLPRFDTVDVVPKIYFEENRSVYGLTERVLDGDTIRVRHVPGFAFTNDVPEPLQKRSLVNDTLLIRLYGIDAPETAKKKGQDSQPFGLDAKQLTTDLTYHQMVKITLLNRDQYGRAIAVVETVPKGNARVVAEISGVGPHDVSIELARQGFAELYTGRGADYFTRKDELEQAVSEAKRDSRGIWSLGVDYVSASAYKRQMRSKQAQSVN